LKKLRDLTGLDGNTREKKKLMRELDAIRKSGEGLVTAPKSTTILKRSIFGRAQKEKTEEPVTPVQSDDEELDEIVTETSTPEGSGRVTPAPVSESTD